MSATDNGLTVKRCMPFLDAMLTGWIIPLAATVRLEVKDGGRTVTAGWEFDKVMVSNHNPHQVAGCPHDPRPPCKFHNYWTVITPPAGAACSSRSSTARIPVPGLRGVVDTDPIARSSTSVRRDRARRRAYARKGTPLVQCIPFRRETAAIEGEIGPETKDEAETRERIRRLTGAGEGWYRTEARAKR